MSYGCVAEAGVVTITGLSVLTFSLPLPITVGPSIPVTDGLITSETAVTDVSGSSGASTTGVGAYKSHMPANLGGGAQTPFAGGAMATGMYVPSWRRSSIAMQTVIPAAELELAEFVSVGEVAVGGEGEGT